MENNLMELFKYYDVAVNCKTFDDYQRFMELCENEGIEWSDGTLPTETDEWYCFKEDTCIDCDSSDLTLMCANSKFFKEVKEQYKIIDAKEFM